MMKKNETGKYSLQDLVLAGVKWELVENAEPIRKESLEPRVKSLDNDTEASQPLTLNSKLSAATAAAVAPVAPVISTTAALESATAAAATATGFDELCTAIENAEHPLKSFAKTIQPHFCAGARVAIITDAPSGDDEASGKILSGAAGELLDKMLSAIGLARDSVAIIPLVFWRPAGGRTPSCEELALARPFVDRAIELSQPKIILTLGSLAAAEIADVKLPAGHGEMIDMPCALCLMTCIPIFHPNYMLL